ncbi:glycerol kinase GlpK [Nesterenkonia alkaliphila]|uniref:Glycerol kinase n=1 Tax=Nesterenkonia alkaliphila TaxID=1463631 RepID=A0A7K1ULQ7_9MICC|nr:glycerol kinase GlpK [Nesterenkonia alkaliphila]MVT27418.1 glycerol kinase GlpK [Nesterenkonia alkaliphila]GFZ89959.1 glycerol kinase [Nesterenkonia alkaliphila]
MSSSETSEYILSIDQGTTSTRAVVFDHTGQILASAQKEHTQHFPQAGWVEHDAVEIWQNTQEMISGALTEGGVTPEQIKALGITNQRETTVVWDRATGEPIHRALVWQDTRTQAIIDELAADGGTERFKERAGLPLATYFSGPKIRWVLDQVQGARERAEAGELLFGTMDTWLVWNLTGGTEGGVHITDVTNASRTLLMNIDTLDWNPEICAAIGVPEAVLPQIRSSSEVYAECAESSGIPGVPIAGILGDQHAATVGQACFEPGQGKNTYGTGNFMLINTGHEPVHNDQGLLTTLAYKFGAQPPVYALEGSIAVTGSLIQWLRDNLGLISSAAESEDRAENVKDHGGAYIVPAFSGLFAPYWRPEARGVIVGLTRYVTADHLCRAALESVAFQSAEVVEAMNASAPEDLTELKVDGGMVVNETLMQFQADLLGVDVVRPEVIETTALGAAYAAGLATGYWASTDELTSNWREGRRWRPTMDQDARSHRLTEWRKAVERSFNWVD